MPPSLPILLPPPRRIERLEGRFAARSASDRAETRIDASSGVPAEGYRLRVRTDGIEIVASDPAGAFHAAMTLRQLERQRDPERGIPCVAIEDAPAFPNRGVMLDVSRDRVPTMETIYGLVDLLAEWKLNELQLYMEHTFAYARHRDVSLRASPFTAEEIRDLDAYCRERFVELVPNQNSLRHMERWLRLPRYLPLAEAPDGFDYPWGGRHEGPHSLNPTDPRTLDLLRELYDELLPNFTSARFNVGLDETWDIGQGRSRAACEAAGVGRVYLEFLKKVHREVELRGKSMQFWGDVILNHPELIPELPPGITALEWGYEADHPFEVDGAQFAAARVPFWVCPGTSSWNSIAGRAHNAVGNIRAAAAAAMRHGATGLLVTDWGDNGHWQPPPVSWLGFAQAAASAWSGPGADDIDLRTALDLHAFRDEAGVAAGVAFDLGNAYQDTGVVLKNATVLARLLLFPERPMSHPDFAKLTVEGLERAEARIEGARSRLPAARMARSDARIVVDELRLAGSMLTLACRLGRARIRTNGGAVAEISPSDASSLARGLEEILAEYPRLWLERSRPGGLPDSLRGLAAALPFLRSG
jgi:hypothetical protein